MKYHGGAIYAMSRSSGIANAKLDKWAKGMVKKPEIGSLRALAKAYQLDADKVIRLVYPEE